MTRRVLMALGLACSAASAQAQTGLQLWGNLTLDWVKSDRITYEVDFEPKALVAVPEGHPDWRNLDITPGLAVAAANWLDLTAELTTGFTRQNDDLSTFELTPRIGAEFHLLSRRLPTLLGKHERPPHSGWFSSTTSAWSGGTSPTATTGRTSPRGGFATGWGSGIPSTGRSRRRTAPAT